MRIHPSHVFGIKSVSLYSLNRIRQHAIDWRHKLVSKLFYKKFNLFFILFGRKSASGIHKFTARAQHFICGNKYFSLTRRATQHVFFAPIEYGLLLLSQHTLARTRHVADYGVEISGEIIFEFIGKSTAHGNVFKPHASHVPGKRAGAFVVHFV